MVKDPSFSHYDTDIYHGNSHCEILNELGELVNEKKCTCQFKTFMNIAMVKGCEWEDVPLNETVFMTQPAITTTSEPASPPPNTDSIGILNPFLNTPSSGSLESLLMIKNSMFSGFLGSLYQTFLYGDEKYNTRLVDDQSTREDSWQEHHNPRFTNRQDPVESDQEQKNELLWQPISEKEDEIQEI